MLKPSKRFLPFLLSLLVLSAIPRGASRAQDAGPSSNRNRALLPSSRRSIIHTTAGPSTASPDWDNGYLISRDVETFQAGDQNVRLYDSSGNQVVGASIWFPQAMRVLIYSATATPDGKIIAGGTVEKLDDTAASFIAMTDPAGKITNVIQTPAFGPLNICSAPDGTVWSFGGTGFEGKSSKPKPGNALRHFDLQKGEVASYLARSSFPNLPRPETQAAIRCSAGEVVAYSFSAHVLIQMKYAGDAPEVYHTEEPIGMRFHGFAVTGPKKIFGYFWESGKDGLYYLAFDDAAKTAQWVPVPGTVGDPNTPGVVTALRGADGDNLVVSFAEDPLGASALHWVSVVDR